MVWTRSEEEHATATQSGRIRALAFSRVAYDSTGTRAVLHVWMRCGSLCGHGAFYSLVLEQGAWRMAGFSDLIVF